MALEIERKFLIKKLPEGLLERMSYAVKKITQSYLVSSLEYPVRRIRKTEEKGVVRYFYTLKRQLGDSFVREEIEKEIDENSYLELQKERDFALNEIVKTRYVISGNGLEYEVDRFAFFDSFDLLEIELPSEDTEFILLEEFEVIKEVSTDYRFTNVALAKEIPTEI